MSVDVQKYCGVQISNTGGETAVGNASSVEASWNTGAQLWDDGENQWIFWGLTEGELTIYELELAAASSAGAETVYADYDTALTVVIKYGSPVPATIVTFTDVCYYFGTESKRLKPLGDRFVMEGGLMYKILKSNDA